MSSVPAAVCSVCGERLVRSYPTRTWTHTDGQIFKAAPRGHQADISYEEQ